MERMESQPSYATPTRAALNRQKSSSNVIPEDTKSSKSAKSGSSNNTSPVQSMSRKGSNTLLSSASLATVHRRQSVGQQHFLMHSSSAPSLQITPSEDDGANPLKYDPAQFSVLVVGPGCEYEKEQLKQRNLKVFGIEPPNAAIMLLRKHGNAIHLIIVSTEIENMSLEEFLEELKDSGLDHIPVVVLYRNEVEILDSLMERGVSECLTHNMPAGLFRSKIDSVLQLHWYKTRYQTERQRRNSLEKEFSRLFALSGLSREQLASDLHQVGKAWETPAQIVEKTKLELSTKDEINIDDYKEALLKVVKPEVTSPELQSKLLNDSKFSTLDRKTQDWVLREYTRTRGLSSGSFTTSKENFWKLFGTKDEPNNPKELDSEIIQFARKAFAKYDVDSDGTISLNELAEAMKDHGMSEEQAIKIMNKFDVDGNGSISFKEFLKGFPEEIFRKAASKPESVEKIIIVDPEAVERGLPEVLSPRSSPASTSVTPEKKLDPLFPDPAFSPVVTLTAEPLSTGKPLVKLELYDIKLYEATVAEHKETLRSWEFDMWKCSDDELIFLLLFMFEDRSLLEVFQIPREKLINFVSSVRNHYRSNPYHNWRHAWDVMHTCFLFISQSGAASYLTHIEILSLFVAAICHDLEHPGVNNTFQVNLQTPLALLYNDTSVLENHHCSCAFSILRNPENNIFEKVMPAEFKQIRKIVIESILQTDMAYHFELVAKFTSRTKKPEPYSKDVKEDRQLLVNILLHSADLSNSVKPWKVARYWSDLVQTEFLSQGDKEKELGLPISMYMDRDNYNQAKMSLNFFNFIVEPLFTSIKELLPKIEICLGNLFYNKKMWTMIEEENQKQKQDAATAAVAATAPVTPSSPVVEKLKEVSIDDSIEEEPLPSPAKNGDDEPSLEYKKYQTKQSTKVMERINKTVVKAWTDNLVPLRPGTASPTLSPTSTTLVAPIFSGRGLPAKNKKPPIAGGYYQSRRPVSPASTLRSLSAKLPPKSSVLLNPLYDPSPRLYRTRANTLESL